MIARFSDLMNEYRDEEYDLPDRGYADPERIKSLTAARVAALRKTAAVPAPSKKRRHVLRTVLLAAAFAALLSVTAYAVYQRTMADRVLEGGRFMTAQDGSAIVQYSAVGGSNTGTSATAEPDADAPAPTGAEQYATYSGEKGTYYSSMGKNREYEAQKEWAEFYFSDMPLDARDMLDYSDPHRLIYGVGYGVLAEKLDAIAEKYGLRLMQSVAFLDTEQEFLDTLALDSFYPAADDEQHTFCVYDDGSFEANGLSLARPEGEPLGFNVMRAVRGTLTDFLVLGGDPALADFETYTTASGTEVDIALEDTGSFLFADMEHCHVTFWFYEGRREGLTMADLEAAADSIAFAALDEINVPAVAQNVEAGMEQNMQDNPGFYRQVTGKTQRVYDELGDYSLEGVLPEGWQFTSSYVSPVEDAAERLESLADQNEPGPADYYDGISLNYYRPETGEAYSSDKWVTLTYERYWGDPDRAVIRNAQAFHARRQTSISGPGYGWEPELIACAVGGFDAYYTVSNHFGSRVDSVGTYLTWYDTDKQLLFTLSTPMPEFSVQDTLALAADFAASVRDVPGPAPTGTVSDEVERDDPADVSELGVFGLTPPEGFIAGNLYGSEEPGAWLRATQVYANGGDPLAGYDRLMLSWQRVRYEDGWNTEDAFYGDRDAFGEAAQDAAQHGKEGYSFAECTVNGMEGFVYELLGSTGPTVSWLDGERDLRFNLWADNTLAGDCALFDADALVALANTVAAQ